MFDNCIPLSESASLCRYYLDKHKGLFLQWMKIFTRLIDGNRNMDIGYYYYFSKESCEIQRAASYRIYGVSIVCSCLRKRNLYTYLWFKLLLRVILWIRWGSSSCETNTLPKVVPLVPPPHSGSPCIPCLPFLETGITDYCSSSIQKCL